MRSQTGLSFVDVLIILAIVLLLGALAVPRFIEVPDYGNEEDEQPAAVSNTNKTSESASPAASESALP